MEGSGIEFAYEKLSPGVVTASDDWSAETRGWAEKPRCPFWEEMGTDDGNGVQEGLSLTAFLPWLPWDCPPAQV